MKKAWTPPVPIRDPPGNANPWPDKVWVPRLSADVVAFIDEGHQYFLQDDHRAYPCHIISGSKMVKYWEAYVKIQQCGCVEETDPIVQVGRILAQDNFSRQHEAWVKRHKSDGGDVDEGDVVPVIREMFTRYVNGFASWGTPETTFAQRAAKLQECSPTGAAFPHHTKHRALKVCEEWIVAPLDQKPQPEARHDEGWTDFLRYLCHPTDMFSGVTAACLHGGGPLAAFLEQEWHRCGRPAAVSAKEANIVKFNVPTTAGVAAHRYIECVMDPARGVLPELHEHEDAGCLALMFAYLKNKGIAFSPENIEKRVGSKLYKFCGTMDAFRERPDGTFEVWDWKRSSHAGTWLGICTQPDPEDPHWVVVDTPKVTFSSALMTYFLQAASYRQLELLTNPHRTVSTSAFLGVFHPNLDRKFVVVEMRLGEKLQARALTTSKGITTYVDEETGQEVDCVDGVTPIEYVQCFMHHRLQHLKRHFKCEPDMGN